MGIVVEPDPPREGQNATITVTGSGPHFYRVGNDDWQPLPVDEEGGSATVLLPPGSSGQILDVSDRNTPDSDDHSVAITSTG
jgi:hypothetical protein